MGDNDGNKKDKSDDLSVIAGEVLRGVIQESFIQADKAATTLINKSSEVLGENMDTATKTITTIAETAVDTVGEIAEATGEVVVEIVSNILKP